MESKAAMWPEIMARTSPEVQLPLEAILLVLKGVKVAVKAPKQYIDPLADCLASVDNKDRADTPFDQRASEPDSATLCTSSIGVWRTYLESKIPIDAREIWSVVDVTLAVTYLREQAHKNLPVTAADLDTIWTSIHRAITTSQDSGIAFSANRSAQGFLAVPLCSLVENGKIAELWRFHVWLPDNERGVPEVAIHAHQPFAQSWILAGCGTDHTYDAQEVDNVEEATHARYDCCYMPSGNSGTTSSGYQTHQLSSTVTNSGKYIRVSLPRNEVHTRDMSYIVSSGRYHKSEVSASRFHATLFVFDASKGFDDTAGVLGPIDGKSFTQLRDPKGLNAQVLAEIAAAARCWEQEHSFTPDLSEDEHPTILAYHRYFRAMELVRNGAADEAEQWLTSEDGNDLAHAFAKDSSPRQCHYIEELIRVGANVDVADKSGFTVLDYAVCHDNFALKEILFSTLRSQLGERKAGRQLYESNVRRSFREVFEKELRPILLRRETDGLQQVRRKYASLLENSVDLRQQFDGLRYIALSDFMKSERLPRFTDGVLHTFSSGANEWPQPEHLVYFAYRWIYKHPETGKTANDDKDHTQFKRMRRALAQYLELHPAVDSARLGIWLDSVCIDRQNPVPGIAALPINLAQCDALITIEDEDFWSRAWCSVEVLMIQRLRRLYPYYSWHRYTAHSTEVWSLQEAAPDKEVSMANLSMTWEEERDKIIFLQRQAMLL